MGSSDVVTGFQPPGNLPDATTVAKRKREVQPGHTSNKKQQTGPSNSQIPRTLPLEPHTVILDELRPKYEILTLSIISSSKVEQRVATMLAHLGRFHPIDLTVLPGVVLLHCRGHEASKMISVVEIVRRRVHETGQKWYQYNRVYEVETESKQEASVIEDTVMAKDGDGVGHDTDEEDNDDFEVMPSRFKDALGERSLETISKPYMSIFLSRVPVAELRSKDFITFQSNDFQINKERRKRFGV